MMVYADAQPPLLELSPSGTASFTVQVSNASNLIDAYAVSVFGLDSEWVEIEPARLSLFPEETGTVHVTISLPEDFPAGQRILSVQVTSENEPTDFSLVQTSMLVSAHPRLELRVDPVVVTGGKVANYGLVVTNAGNQTITALATGIEGEEEALITFEPRTVDLAPGQLGVIQAQVTAKRPWFGTPKVRQITFSVTSGARTDALASFVQKPRITRGLLSLLGLLLAAAVFAAVLSKTFDKVSNESKVDQAAIAASLDKQGTNANPAPVKPTGMTGSVQAATTQKGIPGVQAQLFASGNTTVPIASAATNDDGAFTFNRLGPGKYKMKLTGAGFSDIWYPGGTLADAEEITVEDGKVGELKPVLLAGRPGTVKGVVQGDAAGAVATLFAAGTIDPKTAAVVQKVAVGSDGTFSFANIPAPAAYTLAIEKPGYVVETRDVTIGAGGDVSGIEVTLRKGDGRITGSVQAGGAALGGASITATDGTKTFTTASYTQATPGTTAVVGGFDLFELPTPATYSITVSKTGYRSETRTVSLGQGETSPLISLQLQRTTGSMSGNVQLTTTTPTGTTTAALGNVTITIEGADKKVITTSVSAASPAGPNTAIGGWYVGDLPVPATYTVTFSGTGLVSQVQLIDLDPNGPNGADRTNIDVALTTATGGVKGTVKSTTGAALVGANVSLTDGTTTRTLVAANDPAGGYEFGGVPAGSYTLTASQVGATPSVVLVNITAGTVTSLDVTLQPQASITGEVTLFDAASNQYTPLSGATVRLFLATAFPGPASTAAASVTTAFDGTYTFVSLDAPQNYVIAVYASASASDPIDSRVVATQPSTQSTAPTFQLQGLP